MNKLKLLLTVGCICLGMAGRGQDVPVATGKQPNIICVMPFSFTENGLGFGGSYERVLDKRGVVAFYFPVMVTFDVANSNRIYDYNTGNYSTGKADAMYYAMPGVKCYPWGSSGKIKYAAGISLVAAAGKISSDLIDLNGLNVTEQVQSHFIMGGLFQNSVNVISGKNLYLGVEVGVGGTFVNQVGGSSRANELLVQGELKVGRRF